MINDGTEKNMKITVFGNSKADEHSYEDSLFNPDDVEDYNVTQLTLDFSGLIDTNKRYTVSQQNQGAAQIYPADFPGGTKTKTYDGTDLVGGYGLLLTDKPGIIIVKLSQDGQLIQTVQITNKVVFEKKD